MMNAAVQKGSPALNRGTMKRRVTCVTLTHQNPRCIDGYCLIVDLRGSEEVFLHRAVPSCVSQRSRESKEPRRYHSELNMQREKQ